jgi:4-deoxy-L-threo-5-hexosulose-uronate ketol-isomerase
VHRPLQTARFEHLYLAEWHSGWGSRSLEGHSRNLGPEAVHALVFQFYMLKEVGQVEIRYAVSPEDAAQYSTDRLRKQFLVRQLFEADQLKLVYTHHDRVIIGGAAPVSRSVELTDGGALKTAFFLERRELGIINVGGPGVVHVEGTDYPLGNKDCLYVGSGSRNVTFRSERAEEPARFYMISTTAHHQYPTARISVEEAKYLEYGANGQFNRRNVYQYIHAGGIRSCQLMMGITLLNEDSNWLTMPAHVHDRRMEVYFYCDVEPESRVFHFMGEPHNTRHLVVDNEEAVIVPGWSIHSCVGMRKYVMIWAMAGENYEFADMEPVRMEELR